ncbi:hypothetical protein CTAYLR_003904 [Chrysophaeum taylorii]|uniref:Ankyrin repeat protein n=1 Tax=Chrysophaeum taylorii TaxID=2483200 RepID=A0AAD7XJQ9_9STRA|nr:hypothetical protein CTAYLR_003904 [Chrysophaeum taylorii]
MATKELLLALCLGAGVRGGPSELDYALIVACADGNAKDVRAFPAQAMFSRRCCQLLADGANVNAATDDGETPLHTAGISGSSEVAAVLVAAGASLDARVTAKQGLFMTPLTWFVHGKHDAAIRVLVDAGASVNAIVANEKGDLITALDIAILHKSDGVIDILGAANAKRYSEMSLDEVIENAPPTVRVELEKLNKKNLEDARDL